MSQSSNEAALEPDVGTIETARDNVIEAIDTIERDVPAEQLPLTENNIATQTSWALYRLDYALQLLNDIEEEMDN